VSGIVAQIWCRESVKPRSHACYQLLIYDVVSHMFHPIAMSDVKQVEELHHELVSEIEMALVNYQDQMPFTLVVPSTSLKSRLRPRRENSAVQENTIHTDPKPERIKKKKEDKLKVLQESQI